MNLKKEYKESWKFLRESKKVIYSAVIIFILFFIIGFIFPVFFRDQVFSFINELSQKVDGMSPGYLIGYILLNNAKASLFAMVLGVFAGIFPLVTDVVNGYLLGFVARESVSRGGVLILWRLFPHGVFELPAVLISIGLGFKLGISVFKKKNKIKKDFISSLKVFVLIILPLLIIAGVIEGLLIAFLK